MKPQQENNGFGPIPERRGERAKASAGLLVVVAATACAIAAFVSEDKVGKDYVLFFPIFVTGRLLLSFVIGKVMQKTCQFVEETRHFRKRYKRSLPNLFISTFTFGYGDCVFIFVTVFLLAISHALQQECSTFSHVDGQFWLLIANSCWVALLSIAAGCREPSIAEVSRINERENKNVADGLAWGYYLAHLKIVLPKLHEQIDKSEEYRGKIKNKKIYILVPKDCNIIQSLQCADSRLKADGKLEPYEVYRAGTKRVYNYIVHSIQRTAEEEPCYIVLEYATTLMTLYEMSMYTNSGLSSQQRDEQVVLFYRKLEEILDECLECRDKYELVPFSGEPNEIADVLMNKIKSTAVAVGAEAHA
ncbi:stimulator of interferon genes protein-like [Acropora millepora]|uniref:stimulator of interferon genes protein-like n=1 Tax=Acropora millepora TaxID=45264 RepID=UPI001CF11E36|nr:stimulator of interferon genes protein-like [Acropora millepora]